MLHLRILRCHHDDNHCLHVSQILFQFDILVAQFNELPIDTETKLTRAMELVFEKALDEPVFRWGS